MMGIRDIADQAVTSRREGDCHAYRSFIAELAGLGCSDSKIERLLSQAEENSQRMTGMSHGCGGGVPLRPQAA